MGKEQGERETQNQKQAPSSEMLVQSPMRGSNSWTVRSWPEPKSDAQPTEPHRHPRLLLFFFFHLLLLTFFFLSLFLYFEREQERALAERQRERERERERERIPSSLRTLSAESDAGLELRNHEITTWAKIKSWTLNALSHPGSPYCCYELQTHQD